MAQELSQRRNKSREGHVCTSGLHLNEQDPRLIPLRSVSFPKEN